MRIKDFFAVCVLGVLLGVSVTVLSYELPHNTDIKRLLNDKDSPIGYVYSSAKKQYRSIRRAYRKASHEEIALVAFMSGLLIFPLFMLIKALLSTEEKHEQDRAAVNKSTALYIPRHIPTYTPNTSSSTALTQKEKAELASAVGSAVGAVVGVVFLIGVAVVAVAAIGSLAKRDDDPLGIKKELDR